MSNSLLGFGIAALVAAIVGGGLKAFGFEIPVLTSMVRQILLGGVGIALMVSAEWTQIEPVICSWLTTTEIYGPTTIETGATHSIPLSLSCGGPVDVVLQNLIQDWDGFSGQRGKPGQDGLLVSICGSGTGGTCKSRQQMGVLQAYRQELPAGLGTIALYNFETSPRMTFTLRVKHPQ